MHECFLKEAHATSSKNCHDYSSWEYDSLYWQGQSGPATCGQWKNADAFRGTDVRLYGPTGYDPALDAEPEGGAFTDDGKYFLVGMQDNNAYAIWDVAAAEWLMLGSFGTIAMTMDASDKDDMINIKSRWGATTDQSTCIYAMMDYGGGGTCGYAPVTTIILNDENGPVPGWFSGDVYIDPTLNSTADCQALCAASSTCDYFSYEWENSGGTHYHECFLKTGFEDPTCHGFVKWGFDDSYPWVGASGYGVCPDQVPAYGMFMPDVIKSITIGGEYYFLTANEGGSRDGEDMIGISGDFEGEEIRLKDLESSCGMSDGDCSDDAELGRIVVTTFMPSNYATNAAGDNQVTAASIDAAAIANGTAVYSNTVDCIYEKYDYGGGSATICSSYAPTVAIIFNSNKTSFPGWFSGTTFYDPDTLNSAADCQRWCSIYDGCDFFSCVAAGTAFSRASLEPRDLAGTSGSTASTSATSRVRTRTRVATTTSSGALTTQIGTAPRARACVPDISRLTTCSTFPSMSTGQCRDRTTTFARTTTAWRSRAATAQARARRAAPP